MPEEQLLKLLLETLKELKREVADVRTIVHQLQTDVALLNLKAGLAGAVGGTILTLAIKFLFEKL